MSRILFTKDGRRTGNAIVIKEIEPSSESMKRFLAIDNSKLYLVETDFGNRMKLSTKELNSMFDLGPRESYKKWAADRSELRRDTQIQDKIDERDNHPAILRPGLYAGEQGDRSMTDWQAAALIAYQSKPEPKPDTRPICSEDGCYRRENCGPSCRNRN